MNILTRIARALLPREMRGNLDLLHEILKDAGQSVMVNMSKSGTQANWDYAKFASEGYAANAVVFACIGRIMQAASSVRIGVKLNGELVKDKPPAQLVPLLSLLKRPNPSQAIDEFIQLGVLHQHCGGAQFIRRIGTGTETIGSRVRAKSAPELWLLRPDRVELKWNEYGVTEYKLDNSIIIPLEEVLTVKNPHPGSDFLGLSPLQPLRGQVDSHSNITNWNRTLFENNAVPAGILSVKGLYNKTPADRTAMQRDFDEKYAGWRNAGKVMMLDVDVTGFTQLASSMKELDWLGGKQDLAREICSALGVPSKLLNDPEAGTYANYAEARNAFYTETVIPYMDHLCGELTAWLGVQYGEGVEIVTQTDHIDVLREDANAKAMRQEKQRHKTINELRLEDGLDPITDNPDCDVPVALLKVANPFAQPQPSPWQDDQQEPPPPKRTRSTRQYHPRTLYVTVEQRAAAIDKAEAQRDPWQRKLHAQMGVYFDKQRAAVLKAIRNTRATRAQPPDVLAILKLMGPLYENLFGEIYEGMYQSFGDGALPGGAGNFTIDDPRIKALIANDITERSALIDATTADTIRAELQAGYDANEGIGKLTERISAKFDDMSAGRAEAIARTETCRAQSSASVECWRENEIQLKEWLAVLDDATRDEHAEADGQVVGINEAFSVGGELLDAPGMGYEPGNNINCRCSAAPIA